MRSERAGTRAGGGDPRGNRPRRGPEEPGEAAADPAARALAVADAETQDAGDDWDAVVVVPELAEMARWQSTWLAITARPWRSLAVVPLGSGALAREVANGLAHAAASLGEEVARVGRADPAAGRAGVRQILSVECPADFPAAALLAREADAVVVVLPLGQATLAGARAVCELVGFHKVMGCVVARPSAEGK